MEKEGFKSILDKYSQGKRLDEIGKSISKTKSSGMQNSKKENCQVCGNKMEFSNDLKEREFEYKWSIHYKCRFADIENRLDRETGVLTERKKR